MSEQNKLVIVEHGLKKTIKTSNHEDSLVLQLEKELKEIGEPKDDYPRTIKTAKTVPEKAVQAVHQKVKKSSAISINA
jgi:hypothetical protein